MLSGGVDESHGLSPRQRDRFLAEHVLARFQGSDVPGHMQMVWQRNVNRIDVRIGQQRFVGPKRFRDAQTLRRGTRRFGVARRDGDDLARGAALHRRDDLRVPMRAVLKIPSVPCS